MCELVLIQGETFFFDTMRRPFEDLLYATLVIKTVLLFFLSHLLPTQCADFN